MTAMLDDDPAAAPSGDAYEAAARSPTPPARLGRAALATLPPSVRRPRFDVGALRPGILHLGCGAFHRAHQALMTQRAIEAEASAASTSSAPPPWGIVAASLKTPTTARALSQQDGLYTVLERASGSTRAEVVGSIHRTLFAPDAGPALDAAFGDPAIRIVTLTVTSSGYCVDPTTGRLESGSAVIQQDLRGREPRTAIGLLARGLAQRRDRGAPPPVVLSCDNMACNGRVLQQACVDYAALSDDGLAGWIDGAVQFPATMVDRIVPTPIEPDRHDAARTLGVNDLVPVSTEPFSQWVIEGFDGPRPRWDAAGAEYVGDVAPWEASKLRLLNGGHLAVACLGLLTGATTVAEALERPGFPAYVLRFMIAEQKPTLPPSDHDIDAYPGQLLDRWRNHGIDHRLARIGRDGSGKLPSRLLAPLQDNLLAGRPVPCTLVAVAAWLLCATQDGQDGTPLIDDDRGPLLRSMRRAAGDDASRFVDAAVTATGVFGDALCGSAWLRAALASAVAVVQRGGSPAAMAATLADLLP